MRVVLTHEWLTNIAGSELVLRGLADAFPDAPIVVGVSDPDLASQFLPGREVISLLNPRLPGIRQHWMRYAPALVRAWNRTRLECDLLIASSHFAAHRAARGATGASMVYYHSPMRAAWRPDLERHRFPKVAQPAYLGVAGLARVSDRRFGRYPNMLVANSTAIAQRIGAAYGRSAEVVHPPVARPRPGLIAEGQTGGRSYYLCFGRLVGYKRADLAVSAATRMGVPLVVAGDGPLWAELAKKAGPTVEFVGSVSEERKWGLLANARALIFPGEEDFGIVPVEALLVGTPVIGFGRGGLLDTVSADTGQLFHEQSVEAVCRAISDFERRRFDAAILSAQAANFSEEQFRQKIRALAARCVDESSPVKAR